MAGRTLARTLAIALTLVIGARVAAAEPIKPAHAPITLIADDIATWTENDKRIVGLSGGVLIGQGATELRADQAIAWIETIPDRGNRTSRLHLYAEGNVRFERGSEKQTGTTLLVDFATFGEVSLKSLSSKIAQRSLADAPLFQRARQAREAGADPGTARVSDPGIQQAQFTRPSGPPDLPPPDSSSAQPLPTGPPRITPTPAPKTEIRPATQIPLPSVPQRTLIIAQRSSIPQQAKYDVVNGEEVLVITNGVKLLARFQQGASVFVMDVEADQLIVWRRTGAGPKDNLLDSLQRGSTQGDKSEIELYLAGNVAIRYGSERDRRAPDGSPLETKTLRAEQIYYDVGRNRAIAINGDLEMSRAGLSQAAHFRGDEIWQLSPQEWRTVRAAGNASKLPSDPGVQIKLGEATIVEEKAVRRTIFGQPFFDRETGEEKPETDRTFRGRNVRLEVGGVPVLWLPYLAGDVEDPFGPLQAVRFRQDRIFGPSGFITWDVFDLIGTNKLPNERWQLFTDYLGKRGPALGTEYNYAGGKAFGVESPFSGFFKAYGIYDRGTDLLGGPRELEFQPDDFRGRITWRHVQEFDDFQFQGQVSYLSDPRFYEQYYKYEFDLGPNQETFGYLKWQRGTGAASALLEPNLNRYWVNEAEWLPRVDGWIVGESFFDRLTYSAWGSAGYARLRTSEVPPFAVIPTDIPTDTARIDLMQELSAPFALGALKLVPYAKLDLAYYSNDLNGDSRGRVYGGAGARANLPLSRLYPGAASELLNVKGINHKITFGANYYTAWADTPYALLPQLDRLNDDAIDQAYSDMRPVQTTYVPGPNGIALQTSPLFDPQIYAIRRLVDWRADTLDTMQVVQAEIRQRWQTKRGYPGMEHTVDWLTFDLSASFFPAENRDNFGEPISFVEYNGTWAVGDRTGLVSSGWFDPFDVGTRYWTIGSYLDRPDRTHIYIGYRQFDPVRSKAVTAALTYVFSPKYAVTAATVYDFGIASALSNSLVFTRVGTDLTLSLGISYNAIINNFGLTFEIVPNLMASRTGRGLAQQGQGMWNGR